jgi:uncharacterized membrane-anchored protein YhcB (DUF1043 family)
MYTTEIWIILTIAVIISLLIGFVIGRKNSADSSGKVKQVMTEYEQIISQQQSELNSYKAQVHQHYDETATLFKDMAGSYKKLFDHLSSGSEQLGNLSEHRILPERAGALLDGPELESSKDSHFIDPNHQGDEDALTR